MGKYTLGDWIRDLICRIFGHKFTEWKRDQFANLNSPWLWGETRKCLRCGIYDHQEMKK
jgi:hypothetical protein